MTLRWLAFLLLVVPAHSREAFVQIPGACKPPAELILRGNKTFGCALNVEPLANMTHFICPSGKELVIRHNLMGGCAESVVAVPYGGMP